MATEKVLQLSEVANLGVPALLVLAASQNEAMSVSAIAAALDAPPTHLSFPRGHHPEARPPRNPVPRRSRRDGVVEPRRMEST